MDRKFGVAIVLLVLGAAAVFVATYDGPDSDDEAEPAPLVQDPFPPGTLTAPAGDERDCGEYTRELLDPDSPDDPWADEHSCIIEAAWSGTPAVMVEHHGTTEGDPIRGQYRVLGPRQVEIIVDYTRDQFGGQVVAVSMCDGLQLERTSLEGVACTHRERTAL